ncbi:MAG: HAD family phosphatase [bacterium]|nr:HAD family phosphatase [bacterium]
MPITLYQTTAKGLIFDMDGTMVDNMMAHHEAWQRKLRSLGMEMELEQVRREIHGVNEEILLRLFGDRFNDEERRYHAQDKEAEYRRVFQEQLQLIDGLPDFLEEAWEAELPMGIGTAAPEENVDFVLDNLELRDYFATVKHAGDVTKGKPDPEIYQLVAAGLGIPVKDCVIFEDSPTGAEAAHNAGSPVIVVTTTHKPAEFSHLPNVLAYIHDFNALEYDIR